MYDCTGYWLRPMEGFENVKYIQSFEEAIRLPSPPKNVLNVECYVSFPLSSILHNLLKLINYLFNLAQLMSTEQPNYICFIVKLL